MLFLNNLLLFHCFLGHLPRKPFQIPLIWYIYHLSRSHRTWDMTDWPVLVNAFWSKFSDPYFGFGSTQKPNIWWEFFFMVSNNFTKNHSNRWWSCRVTVLIWHGMTHQQTQKQGLKFTEHYYLCCGVKKCMIYNFKQIQCAVETGFCVHIVKTILQVKSE